jgi:hypothetical protein
MDVTFGPRSVSISTLLTALVQLAAERWQLTRLTYVNFEARGRSEPSAPIQIEDLTTNLQLPNLATAVRQLKQRADVVGFLAAARPFLVGGAEGPQAKDLTTLGDAVEFLRMNSLLFGSASTALGRVVGALRRTGSAGALIAPLMQEAESILGGLRPPAGAEVGSPLHLAALVRWYRHHGRPDRALLLANEALTYLVCRRLCKAPFPQRHPGSDGKHFQLYDYYALARDRSPERHTFIGHVETLREHLGPQRHRLAHADFGGYSPNQPKELAELLDDFAALMHDPGWGP